MRQIRGASLSLAIVAGVLLCGCFAPKPEPSAGPSVSVRSTPLDLDAVGNVKLADFGGLPTGDQTFDGVAYRVGQSGLRVGSRSFPNIPLSAGGVPVGRSFRVARFLHATSGGGYQEPGHPKHEADGVHVADYVIRYEDGTSETFPLRYGQELRDWWNWDSSKATTNAEVGWTGQNPEAAKFGVDVRLFATSWQNPHPEKKVATIDLVSANASAAPFCVAITVDDDPNFTPAPVASPISPPKRSELYDPPRPAPSFEIASAPRERPASSAAAVEPSPPPSSVPSQPSPPPEAKSSPKTPPVAAPPSTESDEGVPTDAPRDQAPPGSTESPPASDAKPTFDLFGAGEAVEDSATVADAEEEAEFLGPPPERWEVVVDPPAALPAYGATLPYDRLDGPRPRRLIAPATPSPFLAVEEGAVDLEGFSVYDLRSGARAASVDGMSLSRSVELALRPALSPDGRLTAVYDFNTKSIYVGDLFKRKTQNRFTWTESNPILLFAGTDRLVAIAIGDRPRIEVWQLPLGAQLASIPLEREPELAPGLIALSPGGRFLALAPTDTPPEIVAFYDLKSGEEVGRLGLPGSVVNAYFMAFAFSPDGTEFAGYMSGLGNDSGQEGLHHGMVVWDVKSGRRTYEAPYEYGGGFDASHSASARPLQWFPDRQGWLISQAHLFGRRERNVLRTLNEQMHAGVEPTGAQILDDRRLLISDATPAGMEIIGIERGETAKAEE